MDDTDGVEELVTVHMNFKFMDLSKHSGEGICAEQHAGLEYQWIRHVKLCKPMEFFVVKFRIIDWKPKNIEEQGWVYASEVGEAFVLISKCSSYY